MPEEIEKIPPEGIEPMKKTVKKERVKKEEVKSLLTGTPEEMLSEAYDTLSKASFDIKAEYFKQQLQSRNLPDNIIHSLMCI